MSEEQIQLDLRPLLAEAALLLPKAGLLPDPKAPGVVKVPGPEAAASLHRDSSLGLAPFHRGAWWRTLERPSDTILRGHGRVERGPVVVASPLYVFATAAGADEPGGAAALSVDEPYGGVSVGPRDVLVVVSQASAAYSAAVAVARKADEGGRLWG